MSICFFFVLAPFTGHHSLNGRWLDVIHVGDGETGVERLAGLAMRVEAFRDLRNPGALLESSSHGVMGGDEREVLGMLRLSDTPLRRKDDAKLTAAGGPGGIVPVLKTRTHTLCRLA